MNQIVDGFEVRGIAVKIRSIVPAAFQAWNHGVRRGELDHIENAVACWIATVLIPKPPTFSRMIPIILVVGRKTAIPSAGMIVAARPSGVGCGQIHAAALVIHASGMDVKCFAQGIIA